jgi:O-antigen/teichoic acid export membrane protein
VTQETSPSGRSADDRELGGRVLDGLAWTLGSSGMLRFLSLAHTAILARLLSPADFGTYGMVMLATGTLSTFTSMGVPDAVVQSRHDVRATLDSAFCINLIRGMLLYVLIYAAAPWIEMFFATQGISSFVRVAGVAVLLGAANNVGPILFLKELDYRRSTLYSTLPSVVAMAGAVILAFWTRSPWALVLSQLAAAAVMLPLSYWAHSYRPRLRLDPHATRHLLRYGSYIISSAPLFYLSSRIDNAVVGRQFGPSALGVYQLAYNAAALPATSFTELVMRVFFPLFARLQEDPRALRETYLKALRHVANVAIPMSGFLFVFADDFIRLVYGPKWASAVPLLMAFSIYGVLRSVAGVTAEVFKATGQTQAIFVLAILNLVIVGWVLLIAAPHGPVWIAWLLSAVSIPTAVFGFDLAGRLIGVDLREVFRRCLPAGVATASAMLVVGAGGGWIADLPGSFLRLAGGGSGFSLTYLAVLVVLDPGWLGELRSLVAPRLARARTGFRRVA